MHTYRLLLEYDGTRYRGWQAQKNAPSIQGKLIDAARKVVGGDIDIQGAGRTDAGVHALGQTAHLAVARRIPTQRLLHDLNDHLPKDICLLSVEDAPPRFHARHHALARTYIYLISRRKTAFGKKYVWWIKDRLDEKMMSRTATLFEGFHDFASFADKRMDKEASTTVSVTRSEVQSRGDLILYRVTASHFLWKMVRRIVGVLVETGRGALSQDEIRSMLESLDDRPAVLTAPPSGLFLEHVQYKDEGRIRRENAPFPFFTFVR